jgi:deoxynogalonate / 12-deoxyaklanonic acid monooxygenase
MDVPDVSKPDVSQPEASKQDISKSVTVPVPQGEAFRLLTEQSGRWLPPAHTFLKDPVLIAMEPVAGGRFYERGADGTEITRGTILDWTPPRRLVVTWRIGPGWRPVFDDEQAARIEFEFRPAGSHRDATEVVATYTQLHRTGEMAATLRAAIEAGDPGESLQRFADLTAGRVTGYPT